MFAATQNQNQSFPMPRACPVEFYVCCYTESKPKFPDATGLPRGDSRSLLFSWQREPPRHKAVASGFYAMALV